ncbi:hypothetical protein AM571_CH00668 [Rhizobium etli 8C-3]|uniref:Uncharacterized protein n=1 Tax=Rhizobium etli 8C-3 TaxID=538025 RepID=A0A1L5P021_RHIET|nr:hypothetical protein AM571_CH00668 [Rhizobium etli 8C-3]
MRYLGKNYDYPVYHLRLRESMSFPLSGYWGPHPFILINCLDIFLTSRIKDVYPKISG